MIGLANAKFNDLDDADWKKQVNRVYKYHNLMRSRKRMEADKKVVGEQHWDKAWDSLVVDENGKNGIELIELQ